MIAANMVRRLFCLPPLGADLSVAQAPHTLRQALYPMVLLYTAAFAGEHEVRRWSGKADRYALSAEFVIYGWWLSYLAILLWLNLRTGCTRHMPADYPVICKQVIVVFFGAGVSKFFHVKAAAQAKTAQA